MHIPWQAPEGSIAEDVRRSRPGPEVAAAKEAIAQRLQMIEANNARRNLPPEYHDLDAIKLHAVSAVAGPIGVPSLFLLTSQCWVKCCGIVLKVEHCPGVLNELCR